MTEVTRESEIPFSYPTFQHAKNFMEAYEKLKNSGASFAVTVTNAALAVELALKALAGSYTIVDFDIKEEIVNGATIQSCRSRQRVSRPMLKKGNGHSLALIYDNVLYEHKRVLEQFWSDTNEPKPLRDVLANLSNDFVCARYIDEQGSRIYGNYELYDTLFDMFLSNESILFSG